MKHGFIICLLTVLIPYFVSAQDIESPDNTGTGGIGFQIGYPILGLSGIYSINSQFTLQGIIDLSGNIRSAAGRIWYKFLTRSKTSTFAYGMLGSFNDTQAEQSSIGFGAGFGVEYDWQSFSPDLPPIWGTAEIGFTQWQSDGSRITLTFGAGLHYYFNI